MKTPNTFLALLCLLNGSLAANAQALVEAEIQEDFAGSVQVSGSIIAGAVLGELVEVANPGQILIKLPDERMAFCLSARTRDGQYWAEGVGHGPNSSEAFRLDRKGGWQHTKALARYEAEDFAAIVRLSEGCALDSAAAVLPVSYSAEPERILRIALNSQRALRLTATLLHSKGSAEGVCTKPTANKRSTAFDYWCRFELSGVDQPQEAKLVITRRMRVGPKVDEIRIAIPTQGSAGK